jgi:hypothetical protein
MLPCVEQITWGVAGPAVTVANLKTLILVLSVTAAHGPLLVDVRVKMTKPTEMSEGESWYWLLSEVAPGLNVPDPDELQTPVFAAPPATMPERAIVPPEEQTGLLFPASTVGVLTSLNFTVSDLAGQTPLPVEVRVKMTEPAAMSAADTE